MSKRNREKRAAKFNNDYSQGIIETPYIQNQPKNNTPIKALNKTQQKYLNLIRSNCITFAIGSAGTGKTYIAASYAAQMLKEGEIDSIVMTRPNVEAGRGFGYLPGDLGEKFSPYIEPLLDVLQERLGKTYTEYLVKRGLIQFKPLEFMRGKTFSRCFYILDEAQNCTPSQMKLFLTRIGEDCKVVIDGDIAQKDISGMSGLQDAVNRLQDVEQIGIVEFTVDDVVRSGMCKEILLRYMK
jgi:phosphate starvation-inducible PhoH-like protein